MRNKLHGYLSVLIILLLGNTSVFAQAITLSHSTSQIINVANSVSCNYGAGWSYNHAENSYFRVFDLQNMGVTGDCFEITSIEVGVENATAVTGNQPINIRLHSLTGTMSSANLSLITSQSFTLPNKSLQVHSFPFNYLLSNTNILLVVEINAPDGLGANTFFIGSNSSGETSPSYIQSVSCAINDPITVATIGFPNMHIVMNVKGNNLYTPVLSSTTFSQFRDTVCEGSSNVVYSIAPIAGNPNYIWNYSGTGVTINGTGNSVSLDFSTSATPGVLSVYGSNSCGNTAVISRPIAIDSQITFSISPQNPEICVGDTVILSVYGGISYRWEPPTGLDTLYGPEVKASPALSHSYTVFGEDEFGCSGTGSVFVTVHPLPTVLFEPENTTVCAGVQDTILLDGADTYAWLPTTGLTLSATGDTAIVNLNSTTTYTIEAVSPYGCESTITKTINVNPAPTPIITFDGERLLTAPTGYVSYMWYVDGLPIVPIAWQHLYNIKRSGLYHVVVTDSNGCQGLSNIIDTRLTGIGEFNVNNVKIFPNPATNTINIESPIAVNVSLLTIDGRKITESENAKTIDISNLSNGLYILEIVEPKSGASRKDKIMKSE